MRPKTTDQKPIKVYFCPKCNSPDVKYIFNLRSIFGLMPRMKCKCGYEAPIFPKAVIDRKKLEAFEKKMMGKEKGKGKLRCPECKSDNIFPSSHQFTNPNQYTCRGCGYWGPAMKVVKKKKIARKRK